MSRLKATNPCPVCGQQIEFSLTTGKFRVHYPLKDSDSYGGIPGCYCSGSSRFAGEEWVTVRIEAGE